MVVVMMVNCVALGWKAKWSVESATPGVSPHRSSPTTAATAAAAAATDVAYTRADTRASYAYTRASCLTHAARPPLLGDRSSAHLDPHTQYRLPVPALYRHRRRTSRSLCPLPPPLIPLLSPLDVGRPKGSESYDLS